MLLLVEFVEDSSSIDKKTKKLVFVSRVRTKVGLPVMLIISYSHMFSRVFPSMTFKSESDA